MMGKFLKANKLSRSGKCCVEKTLALQIENFDSFKTTQQPFHREDETILRRHHPQDNYAHTEENALPHL